jgi:hypothetical protein
LDVGAAVTAVRCLSLFFFLSPLPHWTRLLLPLCMAFQC